MRSRAPFAGCCLGLGLLLLAGPGCRRGGSVTPTEQQQPSKESVTPTVKRQRSKESETWKCADLLAHLREKGIKLFVLGELSNAEGDVPEGIIVVDDKSALARKKDHPIFAALAEKRAGTGALMLMCYRSAEFAEQQIRPDDESSLVWGRFIVIVVGPQPKGSTRESGNEQSRKLVRQIREALGAE